MKKLLMISIVALPMLLIGCGGIKYHPGEPKEKYNPVNLDKKVAEEQLTLIKAAHGIAIVGVDGERRVSIFRAARGGGMDSFKIKEGSHTIRGTYKGINVNISNTEYKAGHEYLIDYLVAGNRIYYWVKDLTNNKVVNGKETTQESLSKK